MPKQTYIINNFSGGVNNLKDPRDLAPNESQFLTNFSVNTQGSLKLRGVEADYNSTINDRTATIEPGYGLAVFESDFGLANTNYVYNDTSGSTHFRGNGEVVYDSNEVRTTDVNINTKFPTGSIISITNTNRNNGFYRVIESTGTSSNFLKVNKSFTAEVGTNATFTRFNIGENLVALADANNGQVDIWQQSVGANGWYGSSINLRSGSLTATEQSKISYYFVDGALRACDGNFNNSSRIKHFGYVEKIHFENATSNSQNLESVYHGWYENNNDLAAPTVMAIDTESGVGNSDASEYPTAGAGFNLSVTQASNSESIWVGDVYEVASSFIYDDNQESLLYVPSSNNTFTATDNNEQKFRVRVTKSFDERISGGRIYFRKQNSNSDTWTLLVDIDLRRGIRASLNADYVQLSNTGWVPLSNSVGSGETQLVSQIAYSLFPNLDTYESINGFPSTLDSISIGGINEGWKTAVVTNRRAFVANVRIVNPITNEVTMYGDRIMYSMPNKFDTFPSYNYIDVVKGDAENYVKLEEFADRLLAFKQKSVQVINISSPSDSNWFLEENIKHNGVQHPSAVVRTDYGLCWVNENGCYIYDGRSITNLIDNKLVETSQDIASEYSIFPPSWSEHIYSSSLVGYSILAYEKRKKQLIVMRDCSGTNHSGQYGDGIIDSNTDINSGDCYIYDFKSRAWTFNSDVFTDQKKYTNFVTDWQGNLFFAYQNSSTAEMRYWKNDDESATRSNTLIMTKDIDFGDPSRIKKIYKIYISYKSNTGTVSMKYSIDNKPGTVNITDVSFSSTDTYKIAKASFSTPVQCQSIRIWLRGNFSKFEINDISIDYRPIYRKVS